MKTAKIKGWVDTQYSMLGFTGAESFQIVQTPVKSKYSHGLRAVCNNSNEVPMFPFLPFTFLTHQHQREERISRLWHYCSRLYGEQEGVCAGCQTHFPFRVMQVDHRIPQAKGGGDDYDNLQMLCSGCNLRKGTGTMVELLAKLRRDGILA